MFVYFVEPYGLYSARHMVSRVRREFFADARRDLWGLSQIQTTRLEEGSPEAPLFSWRLTRMEKTMAAIQTATMRM
jgi:hypothetical protein